MAQHTPRQEALDALCAAMTSGDGRACADLFVSPAFFRGIELRRATSGPFGGLSPSS